MPIAESLHPLNLVDQARLNYTADTGSPDVNLPDLKSFENRGVHIHIERVLSGPTALALKISDRRGGPGSRSR